MNKSFNDGYLGIGSNLNNPMKQLVKCIGHINRLPSTQVVKVANFYRSKAWGVKNQPDFINSAVKIKTKLKPLALLKEVKKIEYRLMQRQVSNRWHARVIDIDLLLLGQLVLNRPELTLPHPLIDQRCFVIRPLSELNPTYPTKLKQSLIKLPCIEFDSDELIPIKNPKINCTST